jgi:hypothetical protein
MASNDWPITCGQITSVPNNKPIQVNQEIIFQKFATTGRLLRDFLEPFNNPIHSHISRALNQNHIKARSLIQMNLREILRALAAVTTAQTKGGACEL